MVGDGWDELRRISWDSWGEGEGSKLELKSKHFKDMLKPTTNQRPILLF